MCMALSGRIDAVEVKPVRLILIPFTLSYKYCRVVNNDKQQTNKMYTLLLSAYWVRKGF